MLVVCTPSGLSPHHRGSYDVFSATWSNLTPLCCRPCHHRPYKRSDLNILAIGSQVALLAYFLSAGYLRLYADLAEIDKELCISDSSSAAKLASSANLTNATTVTVGGASASSSRVAARILGVSNDEELAYVG